MHTPMRVAMAMPLIGFDELPSSPVIRDDTTLKKNPNMRMARAERKPTPRPGTTRIWGRKLMTRIRSNDPPRTTVIGMSRSVRGRLVASPRAVALRSRNDALKDSTMVGRAFSRLMMPPVATAPAPMYRMYMLQRSDGCMAEMSAVAG